MERWYALHTKPHKEYQVSSFLESKGYEIYLPTIQVRKNGRERAAPFFSCYLFIRMDASLNLCHVRWTPGLRKVVTLGGRPVAVPEDAIRLIKERLSQIRESGYPTCLFKPGDRAVPKVGPSRVSLPSWCCSRACAVVYWPYWPAC